MSPLRCRLFALTVALTVALIGTPGVAQIFPGKMQPLAVPGPGSTSAPTTADVNGDGIADLLFPYAPTLLHVMLGDGAGAVGPPIVVTVPDAVLGPVTDLTGDGHADLLFHLSAPLPNPGLRLMAGAGDGTFAAPILISGVNSTRALAAGDVDEDGVVDLVVLTSGLNAELLLLPGTGGGALAAPKALAAFGLSTSAALALADLDGDGHLDLAAGSGGTPGLLHVLLGDGLGGFVEVTTLLATDERFDTLLCEELNGDAAPDLVAFSHISEQLVVLHGDGAGGFSGDVIDLDAEGPSEPVLLHDTDLDGDVDVLFQGGVEPLGNSTMRMENDGAGSFGPPLPCLPAGRLYTGHFDADGLEDLLMLPLLTTGLVIAPALPTGGWRMPTYFPTEASENQDMAVGDVDGDGHLDLVASFGTTAPGLSVRLGDGTGNFSAPSITAGGPYARYVTLGDANGDGLLDLISSNAASSLAVRPGDGLGGFGAATVAAVAAGNAARPRLADLNADGVADLVCVTGKGTASARVSVLPGDGHSGFGPELFVASPWLYGGLSVSDLDHDGDLDVVCNTTGTVRLFLGDGAGGLSLASEHAVGGSATLDLVIADVNLDGEVDVLTAQNAGFVGVLLGDGAGGLLPVVLVPAGNGAIAQTLAVGDVSGDGLPDLVLPRLSFGRFFVLLGDGLGGFANESPGYYVGNAMNPTVLADFDGDDRPDIATFVDGAVAVLTNLLDAFAWKDLGHGLAAPPLQPPALAATGTLRTGETVKLVLSGARPLAPGWLVIGNATLGLPFKGGTLVPAPGLIVPVQSNAVGTLVLQGPMPASPAGFTWVFQVWLVDAAGPAGLAASNALSATVP